MRRTSRTLESLLATWTLCAASAAFATEPAPPGKAPAAAVETFDDQARFIAGLPVSEGSPLAAIQKENQDWQDYAKALEEDWARLEEKRLGPMRAFAARELSPKIDPEANLFYLFGGPDLISALALYPEAPAYVLAGLETIGEVPQISTLKKASLDRAIDNLRTTIRTTIRASFFRTDDMAADLSRTEFKGVLPILFLFAARAELKLLDVKRIDLDERGEEHELAPGAKRNPRWTAGVRLRVLRRGHEQPQTVYYLRQDVGNAVLEDVPGFLAFFRKRAPAHHFFKAASFILHDGKHFSKTRDVVLQSALSILQDDSGVPFARLKRAKAKKGKAQEPERWTLHLYGTYLEPLPPFAKHFQEDLAQAFRVGPVAPLPFVSGYRRPGKANLVLAIARKKAEAKPAGDVKPADTPRP